MNDSATSWLRKHPVPLLVFAVVAAYFLWTEHRAHVIEALPLLLLLCCVVMHLFMHGGHGHGKGHDTRPDKTDGGTEQ